MFESLSDRLDSVFEKLRGPEREGARVLNLAAQPLRIASKGHGHV